MNARNNKSDWFVVPLVVTVILLPEATDAAQRFAVIVMALVAAVFARWAARLVWTPLLQKTGFWPASLMLIASIIPVSLLVCLAAGALGMPRPGVKLVATAVSAALLFSWAFAAIQVAQNPERKKA